METSNPKAALVDEIKKSSSILVTVSRNPSVDALAAALGFSLMLNKLEKHATAVFSGAIPPAIQFLEPQKTFENSVSSLRDFIIALDKEKADRLRYKVEGDVVRIYITPYKTAITQDDLQFSEGDFNVDLVIALGVEKQSDLDDAISAHGRILHDATVATVNLQNVKSSLGTVDWSDDKASSLCEMLMSLSEALQSNLLDEQISTALLTGIVAATDRFSNQYTSPRVMTMSAQLMAAGANQQLISEKLEAGGQVGARMTQSKDGATVLSEGESSTVSQPNDEPVSKPAADGEMHVTHDDEIKSAVASAESYAEQASEDRQDVANAKLEQALGHMSPATAAANLAAEIAAATKEESGKDWRTQAPLELDEEPLMGGTLNATATEAEEAKRAEARSNRNHTLLNHDSPAATAAFGAPPLDAHGDSEPDDVDPFTEQPHSYDHETLTKGKTIQPVTMAPINAAHAPLNTPQPVQAAPFTPFPAAVSDIDSQPGSLTAALVNDSGLSYEEAPLPSLPALPSLQTAPSQPQDEPSIVQTQTSPYTVSGTNKTLADLEAEVHAAASASPITNSIDDARAAVSSAFGSQPLSVGGQTTVTGQVAPHDDFVHEPIPDGPIAPPPLPPMPDFSTLPPLPPLPGEPSLPNMPHPGAMTQQPQTPPTAPAPGQFQIPGQ